MFSLKRTRRGWPSYWNYFVSDLKLLLSFEACEQELFQTPSICGNLCWEHVPYFTLTKQNVGTSEWGDRLMFSTNITPSMTSLSMYKPSGASSSLTWNGFYLEAQKPNNLKEAKPTTNPALVLEVEGAVFVNLTGSIKLRVDVKNTLKNKTAIFWKMWIWISRLKRFQ